jgi:hypothetical protein
VVEVYRFVQHLAYRLIRLLCLVSVLQYDSYCVIFFLQLVSLSRECLLNTGTYFQLTRFLSVIRSHFHLFIMKNDKVKTVENVSE